MNEHLAERIRAMKRSGDDIRCDLGGSHYDALVEANKRRNEVIDEVLMELQPSEAELDAIGKLADALKEIEMKPNCWCDLGHWWTSPQGVHSERCKRIKATLALVEPHR